MPKSDGGQEVKHTGWESLGFEGSEYAKALNGKLNVELLWMES